MGFLDKLMGKIDNALGRGTPAPLRTSCAPCPPCPKCGYPNTGAQPFTDADAEAADREGEAAYRAMQRRRFDARSWLKKNANPDPFASESFNSKADVLTFIANLYKAGARTVKVAAVHDDPQTVAREGGPYADTLYVTVKSPKAKLKVNEVAQKANPSEMNWRGKNTLRLWWD
jgi:hypothetical protein